MVYAKSYDTIKTEDKQRTITEKRKNFISDVWFIFYNVSEKIIILYFMCFRPKKFKHEIGT